MFKNPGIFAIALLAAGSIFSAGNISVAEDMKNSELTHGNVQMNLQVGETSQYDVLEAFGAPNITTVDGTGQEVWTYERHATVTNKEKKTGYATIIIIGGSKTNTQFESSSRSMILIIKFDSNKIVSDFKSRYSSF